MKCGTELDDDARFCPGCGQPVNNETAPKNSAASQTPGPETSGEVPAVGVTPAAEKTPAAPADFSTPDFTEKKTKKFGKKQILRIVAAVVAVAVVGSVVAVALNFKTLKGSMIKLFGSDMDYFKYVESREFKRYAEMSANLYDTRILANIKTGQSATTTLSWNISDDAFDLMDSFAGQKTDFSWLNDVEMKIDTNVVNNAAAYEIGLNISGKKVLTLSEIIDYASGKVFMSVPELTNQTLVMGTSGMPGSAAPGMPDIVFDNNSAAPFELISQFGESLPSKEIYNKLLETYIDVVLNSIDDVTSEKETIEIEDISQKCTVLEARISEKTLCDIMKAVLQEAKKDKEIKAILESVQEDVSESGLFGKNVDVYEEFIDAVDNTIEAFDDMREYASAKTFLVITGYVNSKHEVIGQKVTVQGKTILDYVTVQKGKKFASELRIGYGSDAIVLKGSGTQQGNKKSGSYTLRAGSMNCLDLEIANLDTKALEQGYLDGTFRITPKKAFLSQIGLDGFSQAVLSGMRPTLELKWKTSDTAASLEINLLNQDDFFAGVTLKSTISEGKAVEIPKKDLVSAEDEEAMMDFLESIDFDGFAEHLRQSKVPDEITALVKEIADNLEDLLHGDKDSWDDDSWGDDWYDDDWYGDDWYDDDWYDDDWDWDW